MGSVLKNLPCMLCLILAGIVMCYGRDGYGWLLFMAVLLYVKWGD